MVRSLMALVRRRVLAWLVWSDEHAKDVEIVVLRHQLQVLRRQAGRPRFRWSDRLLLAAASRHLPRETWRTFLVTPQTVLRWHRELVRRKWSRGTGRASALPRALDHRAPAVGPETRRPPGPKVPPRRVEGADASEPASARRPPLGTIDTLA
jgi:hypothetical protein